MANSDNLSFDIESLKQSVQNLEQIKLQMASSQKEFLNYINGPLTDSWNTDKGKDSIQSLRAFLEEDFQNYIKYLNAKITDFENIIIPELQNINHN